MPVQQDDVDRLALEALGGGQPAEAAADDHHPETRRRGRSLAHEPVDPGTGSGHERDRSRVAGRAPLGAHRREVVTSPAGT